MSSMTMAAPSGDSTYSYSRTTFASSSEASTAASPRNISANPGSDSRLRRRYLIATRVPEASCRARTTSPNPPEPSAFSPVYPGTPHSAMQVRPLMSHQPGRRWYKALSPRQIESLAAGDPQVIPRSGCGAGPGYGAADATVGRGSRGAPQG